MFDYLQKFNNLPNDIKSRVSSPVVMAIIDELENKYSVDLAALVMKVATKTISIEELPKYLSTEFNLDEIKAKELASELEMRIFNNFLGGDDIQGKGESINFNSIPLVNRKEKIKEDPAKELRSHAVDKKINEDVHSVSPTPSDGSANANFFFSAEDEEEIKKLTNKIESKFSPENFKDNINLNVEDIIKKADIEFGSTELLNRFREILKTYLRGVRSEIDVKQSLLKPFNEGGLSFDIESVNKILLIIRESKKDKKILLNNKPKKFNFQEDDIIEEREIVRNRDVEYDLVKAIKEREDKMEMALPKKAEEKKPIPASPVIPKIEEEMALSKKAEEKRISPPPPVIIKPNIINVIKKKSDFPPLVVVDPSAKTEIEKVIEKKALPEKDKVNVKPREGGLAQNIKKIDGVINFKPNIQARIVKQTGKTRMDDVKYVPKVMSSLDELKYMDLISFRRLADTPEEIKNKILNKLELLEEDKYSKRLEGIRAWRICPTNNLYLSMGQESISTGKSIDAIIEERKASGKDYLNNDEFEAILSLNKVIRF